LPFIPVAACRAYRNAENPSAGARRIKIGPSVAILNHTSEGESPKCQHDLFRHWSLERLQKSIRRNEGEGPAQRCRFFCAKRSFEAFLSTRPRVLRLDELSAPGSCECDEPIAPVSGISNGLDETIPFKWLYVVRQRAAVHDKSSGQFTHCGCSHTKDLIQNRQLRHTKAAGCKRPIIELRHASRCLSQRRTITAVLRLGKARPCRPLNGLGHSRLPQAASPFIPGTGRL
jgi:hypothetical protein